MKSRKKSVSPIGLKDITIVDDAKMRKAITAAALGNAMEWFDFGVYGFVAFVLGKVFFPGADPGVQMIAALATFSVPFLIRPLGGLFFGALGDKYGRQKVLAATIVIMSLSTFAIGLIPSYASIGIWAPILLLLAKMAQGFLGGRGIYRCLDLRRRIRTRPQARLSRQLAGLRLHCRLCTRRWRGGRDLVGTG